jgi:shikimate 5-dehydrogenase
MLILQAAYAQEIWIGEFPDINKIKEILLWDFSW